MEKQKPSERALRRRLYKQRHPETWKAERQRYQKRHYDKRPDVIQKRAAKAFKRLLVGISEAAKQANRQRKQRLRAATFSSVLSAHPYLTTDEQEYIITQMENHAPCEICGRNRKLHIDHNHEALKFRGLLCGSCNTAIGLFSENPFILLSAVMYVNADNLESSRSPTGLL